MKVKIRVQHFGVPGRRRLQNFKIKYGLKNVFFVFFEPFLLDLTGKVAESAYVIEIFLFADIPFGYIENSEFDGDSDFESIEKVAKIYS
jgi:hypothetical protein